MNTTNQTSTFYSFSLGGQIGREIVNIIFCVIVGYAIRKIVQNKTMETVSKLLIGNLMMSHFLFWFSALIRLPIVPYLTGIGCVALFYLTSILLYGTVLAVLAVSIDRFIAIRFPYTYCEISKRHAIVIIGVLWMSAIGFCFATLYGGSSLSSACSPWLSMPSHGLWLFGGIVVCSTSSVVAMSAYIMKEVLRHNRSIHDTTFSRDRGFRRKWRLISKHLDTTMTFLIMSLSYCMMILPLAIIFPLMNAGTKNDPTMITLMTIFAICSRISDPFIYIFRQKILNATCCKCLPQNRDNLSTGDTLTDELDDVRETANDLTATAPTDVISCQPLSPNRTTQNPDQTPKLDTFSPKGYTRATVIQAEAQSLGEETVETCYI